MPIAAMCLDLNGGEDSIRNAFFHERQVFCRCRFLDVRCHLTICFASIIHQSMPHSMQIAAVCLELNGCGNSSRKAFFHGREVFFIVLSPSLS